jgi:hypothetical protein
MEKKKQTIKDLNDLNRDLWGMLVLAVQTKNWALIEQNLKRMNALQKKYINIINLQDYEIKGITLALQEEVRVRNQFEKQWFKDLAKRQGNYQELKDNIDKCFGE